MHVFLQDLKKKPPFFLYITELQSDLFSTCRKLSTNAEKLVVHYKQTFAT